MADEHHLKILQQGVDAWNRWRRLEHVCPDLSGADLSGASLERVNFSSTDLRDASLESAWMLGATLVSAKLEGCVLPDILSGCQLLWVDLSGRDLWGKKLDGVDLGDADLRGARLHGVELTSASLTGADLRGADLEGSVLLSADLSSAKLGGANLRGSDLAMAYLVDADLAAADLAEATFDRTVLANLDLSEARGLTAVVHEGPSSVGADTLERTLEAVGRDAQRLQQVEAFFRGAGVREHLITHFRTRGGAGRRYDPAYIAHGRDDAGLARTLYEQLQAAGVRCWLDPKGRSFEPPMVLDRLHWRGERVILCLSAAALESEWLPKLIAEAFSASVRHGRDGLLAVDLDGCLRDGWDGEHAGWLRRRVVADLAELTSGEGNFEGAIWRVVQSLRTRG